MLHIKYNVKNSTIVIVSERDATITLKDVSVEKEENAIRIKGTRLFTFYAFSDIKEEVYLKKIKDECKKSKRVGIFKRRTIQYVPGGTFYEMLETKPYELFTSSFAMEIE